MGRGLGDEAKAKTAMQKRIFQTSWLQRPCSYQLLAVIIYAFADTLRGPRVKVLIRWGVFGRALPGQWCSERHVGNGLRGVGLGEAQDAARLGLSWVILGSSSHELFYLAGISWIFHALQV